VHNAQAPEAVVRETDVVSLTVRRRAESVIRAALVDVRMGRRPSETPAFSRMGKTVIQVGPGSVLAPGVIVGLRTPTPTGTETRIDHGACVELQIRSHLLDSSLRAMIVVMPIR
jgi:hypothetical protein